MTDVQKQCLLTFLGYDTGGIGNGWGAGSRKAVEDCQRKLGIGVDGVWGQQTQAAVLRAVGNWEDRSAEPDNLADLFTGLRYWSPEEFRCRCAEYHEPYCDGWPALPDRVLLELAEDLRARFGRPAHRSSALRCPRHNRDSGGVANSRHLTGKALDFFVEGVSGAKLLATVQADPRCRYAYIIDGQWVHMDVE